MVGKLQQNLMSNFFSDSVTNMVTWAISHEYATNQIERKLLPFGKHMIIHNNMILVKLVIVSTSYFL